MGVFNKSKKEKKEDTELKEYLDKLEADEKEIESQQEKIKLKDLFEKDPLEDELRQYMTEEQLKEEERDKRAVKLFTITSSTVIILSLIFLVVVIGVFAYTQQDDLHKIYKNNIINYYKNKYGKKPKINDIKYLCYKVEREEKCTSIVYAKTEDNNIIMTINDKYADNISISSYYEEYKSFFIQQNPNMELIMNNPLINDSDYSPYFYRYADYTNVMPDNDNFRNLYLSKKLTIIDTIMYQGEIDINAINNMLYNLGDNSKFILIKTNKGEPINLKILSKTENTDIDIKNKFNLDNNIINYELDTTKNNINNLSVSKVTSESVKTLDNNYEFYSSYSVNVDSARSRINQDGPTITSYYMISIGENLDGNNLTQFSEYHELDPLSYKDINTIYLGDKTYIIADKSVSIGNKSKIKKGLFN